MSADITRKFGSDYSETFTVDLSEYNKTGSDVSDILFSVKNNETEADDVIFLKRLPDISFVGDSSLTVSIPWSSNEYSNFDLGKTYRVALGIIWTGSTTVDENFNKIFTLQITQDFFRE